MKYNGNVLACEVADSTGELTAMFYGRPYPNPKLDNYFEINVTGLPVFLVDPKNHIYVVPNIFPLPLNGRVVRYGQTPFPR